MILFVADLKKGVWEYSSSARSAGTTDVDRRRLLLLSVSVSGHVDVDRFL